MSTIQSVHTFTEGMDKDTHPQFKSKASYDHATNLRYYANSEGTSGDLRNIKASTFITNYTNTDEYYGNLLPIYVAGSCVIGDYMIIFAHNNHKEWILRYKLGESSFTLMYESYGALGIYLGETHVDIIGRYESPTFIKIYWAVEGYPVRTANIAKPMTTTGLYDTNYLGLSRLNINTSITLYTPIFNKTVSGGRLETGKVQYAYSLFKKGAQESVISPLSLPIPLFQATSKNSIDRLGDATTVNTGKGVAISIDMSTSDRAYYDHLTLYRLHYSEFSSEPVITVVGNYKTSKNQTDVITDIGGTGLGTITMEEFSLMSRSFFTAKTLESKNNRLFVANIKDEFFDVDFDTRAYRFNSSRVANIYSDYNSTAGNIAVTSSNWGSIDSNHPCVCTENAFYNDLPQTSCTYLYRENGSTMGGEGPNLYYTFLRDETILDSNPNSYNTYNTPDGFNYESNATLKVGYQRGEVYRFGIVFYNNKGQASPAKWIGDIRMPSLSDGNAVSSTNKRLTNHIPSQGTIEKTSIVLGFYLKNMPTTVTGWQIVRAKRTSNDKSVLMSGLISFTRNKTYIDSVTPEDVGVKSGIANCNASYGNVNSTIDLGLRANQQVVSLISPDMFYSPVEIREGDYVLLEGTASNPTYDYEHPGYMGSSNVYTNYQEVAKYRDIDYNGWLIPTLVTNTFRINDAIYTQTGNPSSTFGLAAASTTDTYCNVAYWGWGSMGGSWSESAISFGEAGSCYTLSLNNWVGTTSNWDLPYVHIVRDNTGRYGGYTKEDRDKTEYIPCSKILNRTVFNTTAYGGDTYIGYFGYTNSIYTEVINDVAITANRRIGNHIIFPVESQVNLDLTHDINYFRSKGSNKWLIKENAAGVEITAEAGLYTFTPETNLYQYNTVYSAEQNTSYLYSLASTTDDYRYQGRILYSDFKSRSELKDSWTIFRPANYLDVDLKFGKINKLKKWNNEIYFWQDKAFGHLPIESRALIDSANIGALQMGVAGVLDYYRYITEFQGLTSIKNVIGASKGLYWYDSNNKAIIRYNGSQIQDLTIECKINSYIKSLNLSMFETLGYDYKYNEVLFKIGTAQVLVFNEVNDRFISVYTYDPRVYVETSSSDLYYLVNKPYIVAGDHVGYDLRLYQANSSNGWNYFTAGTEVGQGFQDSTITVTDADNYLNTKVYDNLKFETECLLTTGLPNNQITFDSIVAYNSYQHTGNITIVFTNLPVSSGSIPVTRREREFVLALPRNIVTTNGTNYAGIDISDPLNQNRFRDFKERLRDKTLTVTLTRDSSTVNTGLSFPYLTFVYRISIR